MTITLTTLCENTVAQVGLRAEWGLSILVETDDVAVLLDTGQDTAATFNAAVLDVDLSALQTIVQPRAPRSHGWFVVGAQRDTKRPCPPRRGACSQRCGASRHLDTKVLRTRS